MGVDIDELTEEQAISTSRPWGRGYRSRRYTAHEGRVIHSIAVWLRQRGLYPLTPRPAEGPCCRSGGAADWFEHLPPAAGRAWRGLDAIYLVHETRSSPAAFSRDCGRPGGTAREVKIVDERHRRRGVEARRDRRSRPERSAPRADRNGRTCLVLAPADKPLQREVLAP